ncbi:MAG: Ig-like domain-containing protein [Vicinamibacterales bacterium]
MSHLKQLTRRTRAAIVALALFGAFGIAQMPGHGQSASLVFDTAFEGEIWQALPKFGHASACFDFNNFVPLVGCQPTSEDLLYPVDVALSETGTLGSNGFPTDPLNYRVYVTDSFNNRLVVFRYDPTAADANPTDGYGWAPVTVPGAQWNSLNLSTPDHVVTDQAGNVYVADYGHNRVVVFNANGQMLAALPSGVFVYGIDVTPGTVWGTGGTIAVNGIDFGDGVNDLIFYDAATGAEVHRYQAPIGDLTPGGLTLATGIAYDNDASHLIVADYGATRIVSFAVDANGFPVDTDPNDGTIPNTVSPEFPAGEPTVTPALVFGRPIDFSNPSKGDLQSPFSVNIDARGRILVGDTDNQRLAIYQPSYPSTGPASATFLFELNASGGLNGYPRGLTEDAVGRLIVVDTVNHEIEVFQIPDLAVVDVTVAGPRSFAPDTLRPEATISGSFVAGDPITVDFSVMVPETQFQVTDMVPSCAATDSQGALAVNSGPTLVGWTANVTGDPLADFAADGDIDFDRPVPLDLYRFQCTFTARVEGPVDFQLSAAGNGGVTASQDRQSTAVVGCADCETGVPDITGAVSDPLPARDFYSVDVTIDLNAVDQEDLTHPEDPRAGLAPTGIKRTYWQWVYGPLAVADNDDFFIGCDDYPGTTIQCDGPGLGSGDPSGFTYPLTYDVQVGIAASEYSEGYNTLEYWTVDAAGNRTARKSLTVAVDQTAPTVLFNFPTPTGSCWNVSGVNHCWYNGDVSVPFNLFDNFTPSSEITIDGSAGPFSPMVFNQDGENPAMSLLNLTDLAGNVNPEGASDNPLLNGRVVHIDRLAPVTQFSCTWTDGSTTLDCSAGGTFPGGTVTFSLPATDDLSGVNETYYTIAGSANQATASLAPGGTVTVSNTGTASITYWSKDNAGNGETHRTVQVLLNQPPIASDDTRALPEDSAPVNIAVLANDSDPDGDLLSVSIVSGPSHGTASVTAGREIAYTPNPDYNGPDAVTYTIADGNGGTSTATLTIDVTPVNDPPVAVADATITSEDTPLTIAPATLLANDTDVDGDTLSFVWASNAVNGTVAVVAGNVVFTPAPDFHGTASFTYSIQDPSGRPSSATVTVTVTPVNDPPVATPDAGTTPEDTAVTLAAATLLANDTDVDGDTLTVQSVSNAVNGSVVLGGAGAAFTPAADFNGTASFDYTVSDGNGGTATTTVTIDVTPVNDPPVAADDQASTTEDTAVTIAPAALVANDTDPENDTLTVAAVANGSGGTVALVAGQVVFTPAADFNGAASFTYTVDDGNGGTDTATVAVDVTPVNDPPVAVDDAAATPEDAPLTLAPSALLANDLDVDGDTLTLTGVGGAVNGTVALVAGQVVFTPAPDFNGAASFTYTVSDGNGGTASATVVVTVTPVNDPPAAADDQAATSEDTPLTVAPAALLANDTDPDGDTLTITAVGGAVNGSVALVAGQVVFTPAPDFNGAASFTYTADDGNGGTATATVTVDVTPVNDPPAAGDDSVTTPEDAPLTLDPAVLLANDTDVDGGALTLTAVGGAVNGTVALVAGQVVFTPAPDFSGTASFTYTVDDGNGGTATATVTVDVTPVNDPPTAVDDAATTPEDVALTLAPATLVGNDTDPDGDTLSVTAVGDAVNGTVALVAGQVVFTPAPGFSGPASFTYTADDGNGGTDTATVSVDVTPVNDPPVAVNDAIATTEDVPVTIAPAALLANDTDVEGDTLTLTAVGNATGGTVALVAGQVVFTPAPNFFGTASFTYTVSDGNGGTAAATVVVDVTPVNDVPVAVDDSYTTAFDTPLTVAAPGLLGNDLDADGPVGLAAQLVAAPTTGTLVLDADGSFTFTPAPGFTGPVSFTYTVSDGTATSNAATVTVLVSEPTCVPPTAGLALVNEATNFDGGSLVEGSIQVMTKSNVTYNSGAVFHGDLLMAGTPTIQINGNSSTYGGTVDGTGAASPTGHKVTINGNTTLGHVVRRTDPVALPVVNDPPDATGTRNVNLNNGNDDPGDFSTIRDLTLNGSVGALTVPAGTYRNFTANGQNAFVLGVAGATTPSEYNFRSLTMNGQSTLQVVGPVVVTVKNAQTFGGLVGASDHPEWLTFRVASSGGLQLNGQTALYGYVEVPNGKVVINGGTRLEGGLAADKLTMNGNGTLILVPLNPCPTDGPVNNPPVALDDTAATTEGQAVTVAPLGNDSDADFDTLTVTAVNVNAANATVTVNPDGTLTYLPVTGFTGTDTFTYTIGDGRGGVASASVTVTVEPGNQAPVAVFDTASTEEGKYVRIQVVGNDTDPDDDDLAVTAVTQGAHGTVEIYRNDQVKYTPTGDFTGTDTFTYTISDGNGGTATATVTVTVAAKSGGKGKGKGKDKDDDHHDGDDDHHGGDDDHGHYPGDRDGCRDYNKNWAQDWNWGHGDQDDHDSRGDDSHYPGDRDGCRGYTKNADWSFDHDSDRDRGGRDNDSHSGHYNGDRDGCRNYGSNGSFSWTTGGRW